MKLLLTILLATLAAAPIAAQETTLPAQLTEMLRREQDGHSPTPDEIQAVEALPGLADASVAKSLVPLLTKSLADPDAALRQYSLAMLIGMQSLPDLTPPPVTPSTPTKPQPPADPATAAYKPEVAAALTPLIPAIAARLTDDDPETRPLAAAVLGGFAPKPPTSALDALTSYLRRDNATGPVSLAVINALLQFTPITDSAASAISSYLQRQDIPPDTRASLVESISSKANQNRAINKTLLLWLDAEDPNLRARLIVSLPLLDLDHTDFTATKDRITFLATSQQDPLPVVNAAKSIASCWIGIRITRGCPIN